MSVLDEILEATKARLPEIRSRRVPLEKLAGKSSTPKDFGAALKGPLVGLIAEVKRRSPSAGKINEQLEPGTLAAQYASGGAAAISVLTEATRFGGSMADLERVAQSVQLPVLRKDFILDEVQVVAARASGASALLLIVKALGQAELTRLLEVTTSWQMAALVEVHDSEELDRAMSAGARIIGVNSRNLEDFTIDTPTAHELLATIPTDLVAVAESGMATIVDVEGAAAAGADAVLIGGALATSSDPTALASALSSVASRGR